MQTYEIINTYFTRTSSGVRDTSVQLAKFKWELNRTKLLKIEFSQFCEDPEIY